MQYPVSIRKVIYKFNSTTDNTKQEKCLYFAYDYKCKYFN